MKIESTAKSVVVEIGGSKFGKRKSPRRHHVEGAWMIGGVEQAVERRVFAEMVEKRNAVTLVNVVRRRVAPGVDSVVGPVEDICMPSLVQPIWNTEPSTTRAILSTSTRVFIRTRLNGRGMASKLGYLKEAIV